jgi:hypothetical protein
LLSQIEEVKWEDIEELPENLSEAKIQRENHKALSIINKNIKFAFLTLLPIIIATKDAVEVSSLFFPFCQILHIFSSLFVKSFSSFPPDSSLLSTPFLTIWVFLWSLQEKTDTKTPKKRPREEPKTVTPKKDPECSQCKHTGHNFKTCFFYFGTITADNGGAKTGTKKTSKDFLGEYKDLQLIRHSFEVLLSFNKVDTRIFEKIREDKAFAGDFELPDFNEKLFQEGSTKKRQKFTYTVTEERVNDFMSANLDKLKELTKKLEE